MLLGGYHNDHIEKAKHKDFRCCVLILAGPRSKRSNVRSNFAQEHLYVLTEPGVAVTWLLILC